MKSCLYLIFLFPLFLLSQPFTLKGKIVSDSTKLPAGFASVILSEKTSNQISTFSIADNSGNYSLKIDKIGVYILEINHINHETIKKEIDIHNGQTVYEQDFFLKNKTFRLEDVTVSTDTSYATIIEDTTRYNLKKVLNGSEEKLKDILNKLPGVEVDENGKISANGKPVNKLLIEGDEFFGDNTKMATDNLNAKMVEGVDLIKNYKSFNAISKVDGKSEATAINIKLKGQFKGKITGDASGFGAVENRYKTHTNLFRFSKKMNLSLIADANNTGQEVLSFQEYMNISGSIKNRLENAVGIENTLRSFDVPDWIGSNENLRKMHTKFAGLNFSFNLHPKLKIFGYSLFNLSENNQDIASKRTYFNINNSLNLSEQNNRFNEFLFSQSTLNLQYKPNLKNYFSYSISLEPNKDNFSQGIISEGFGAITPFGNNGDHNSLKIGQQMSWLHKLNENSLLTFNSYSETNNSKSNYQTQSGQSLFGSRFSGLSQFNSIDKTEFGVLTKFSHSFQSSVVRILIGNVWNSDKFYAHLSPWIQTNSIQLNRRSFETEINYLSDKERLNWKLGLKLRNVDLELQHLSTQNQKGNQWFLMPEIVGEYKFNPIKSLRLSLKMNQNFADAKDINDDSLMMDYRNIKTPSTVVFDQSIISNDFNLNFLNLNLGQGRTTFIIIQASQKTNPLTTNSSNFFQYNSQNIVQTKYENSLTTLISADRMINPIRYKVGIKANLSVRNGINLINNFNNPYDINQYSLSASLSSNYIKFPINFKTGMRWTNSIYNYELVKSIVSNTVYNPYLNFEIKPLNKLKLNIDNGYNYFNSGNSQTDFLKTDIRLKYTLDKNKWYIWLEGNNIFYLNSPYITSSNSEANLLETLTQSRLPGYYGFGINYGW